MKPYDFDIIGYKIISPLHMATLTAYALGFTGRAERVKLLVVASKGPWEKSILQESGITSTHLEITIINEEDFEASRSKIWPLYLLLKPAVALAWRIFQIKAVPICSPTMTSLLYTTSSWQRTLCYKPVILDEGIGSFNSNEIFLQAAVRQTSNKGLQGLLIRAYRLLWRKLPVWGGERVSLFRFVDGKPSVNEEIAESYRATFHHNYMARNIQLALEPNTVVILTQPYSEAGTRSEDRACTEDELLTLVGVMAEEITLSGGHPLLKTHPAEPRDKYDSLGIKHIDYYGPVEELFAGAASNIREVWGFNSTSLILAGALFDIKAKVVRVKWNSDYLNSLDHEASQLFETFTETAFTP